MLNRPLSFFLGSTSKIKVGALEDARNELNLHAAICPVHGAESGIAEQPVGVIEVEAGALNRIESAYSADPRGDVYFAIENGIRFVGEEWIDFAIATLKVYNPELLQYTGSGLSVFATESAHVVFPISAVELTRQKPGGFQENTVGKTLKELGLVQRHDDPHLDLCGESRRVILKRALVELIQMSGLDKVAGQ